MGYRVNAQAAALASRRSRVIALVLPHLMNPFFDSIAQSLQEAARKRGYVLFTVLGGADAIEKELEEVLAMRVEGLVFVSPALEAGQLRNLGRAVPVCVIGRAGVGTLGAPRRIGAPKHKKVPDRKRSGTVRNCKTGLIAGFTGFGVKR